MNEINLTDLNSVITYITSLNNKVILLSNKVEKLENELENSKKIINELLEIQKKEEMNLKQKELEEMMNNRPFKDSNIIKLEEEELINNWLKKKLAKCIKLYDSLKDGDSLKTFADKCIGKSPTIVILKTVNGFRFGEVTRGEWKNRYYGIDKDAFLFSLDTKEKYDNTNPNGAFYLDKENSIYLGSPAIRIYDKCTTHLKNYLNNYNCSFKNFPIDEFNGGEKNFKVSSFEVFQLVFKSDN